VNLHFGSDGAVETPIKSICAKLIFGDDGTQTSKKCFVFLFWFFIYVCAGAKQKQTKTCVHVRLLVVLTGPLPCAGSATGSGAPIQGRTGYLYGNASTGACVVSCTLPVRKREIWRRFSKNKRPRRNKPRLPVFDAMARDATPLPL